MKTYEKYKSSGIEWIGDIPDHWEIKKLKYLVSVKARLGWKGLKADEYVKEGFGFLSTPNIKHKEIDFENINYITKDRYDESPEIMLEIGDVLLAKDGSTLGTVNVVRYLPFPSTVNSSIAVLRIKEQNVIHPKFLKLFIESDFTQNIIHLIKAGMGVPHLFQADIKEFDLLFPSITEQAAIANYLDEKTVEIDKLIANKERLIELLKEERTAIINNAVTRGINADAKLKPSGIDWLGDIPERWEVKKLKYLVSKVGSGITPSGGANVYQEEGIPLLRSQNIYFDGLRLDDVAYISEEIDKSMSNSRIKDDDVLLNITGASIGRCFYVPKNFGKGNVNQHVCIIRPIKNAIETKYLHAVLSSGYGQNLIDLCQTGANREGLNFQQIRSFDIPLCEIKEQKEIIEFIESKTNKIDSTISKIEKEIELIKEYRTALISEVVTGKIKVV